MPSKIKGPAIFLAQFAGDAAPFNSLDSITKWAAGLGYKGVQIPTWDGRLFDLKKAASSKAYCDDVKGICARNGVEITELSTHLQGQLVAVHPAYDSQFDGFALELAAVFPAICTHRDSPSSFGSYLSAVRLSIVPLKRGKSTCDGFGCQRLMAPDLQMDDYVQTRVRMR